MKIIVSLISFFGICIFSLANGDLVINEIAASNSNILDDNNEADDWLEIYNASDNPIDLNLYFFSDDPNNLEKWQLQEVETGDFILGAGEYFVFWADNQPEQGIFHLGFTLKKSGETIIINDANLTTSCEITYPSLIANVTYGFDLASSNYVFYQTPTPGGANSLTTYDGITPLPSFDISGGLFTNAVDISLSSSLLDSEIRYTLDNSEPNESSAIYSDPIPVEVTTNIRAKVYKANYISNVSVCQSYIFDSDFSLNVVSISANQNEWNEIYTNYNSGEEIPAGFSYFQADGSLLFTQNLGIKIHAPDGATQKSLRFYARSEYGENDIDFPLFEQRNYTGYKRFILRNGGNDAINLGKTLLRDVFGTSLFGEMNNEYGWSAYQPVHAFVNGEYWGIYNMRERQDVHWLKQNYGYNPEEVDYLERVAEGDLHSEFAGNWDDYNAMEQTAIDLDLSDDDNYAVIDNWINTENLIDYQFSEIFYGNQDWLSNNVKLWKPHDDSRKWEWIIWDVDYGLGRYAPNFDIGNPDFNYLNFALSWGGWGNQIETYLLQNLVENEGFMNNFASRGADLMNTKFKPNNTASRVMQMKNVLTPDIERHFDRWPGNNTSLWNNQVDLLIDWLDQRPAFVRQHFTDRFELGEIYPINLSASPLDGGIIEVNTIQTDEMPWTGLYFEEIPVRIKAIPNPGFTFVEWLETGETNQELYVDMDGEQTYTAVFESTGSVPQLVINEIYYQGNSSNTNDWVEIFNAGDSTVDMTGFTLSDLNNNTYVFTEDAEISANEFILVVNDSLAFVSAYENVNATIFNSNNAFGLNSSEDGLVFSTSDSQVIDTVHYYNNSQSWPLTVNTQSIQLESPTINNNVGSNWYASSETYETPGATNVYTNTDHVNELETDFLIGIYPNPFEDELALILENKQSQKVSVKLFDFLGQEVYDFGWINAADRQILSADLSRLSSGTYFVRLQNENFSVSKAVVKE